MSGAQARLAGRRRLSVLFTCIGRRVELVQAFRRSAGRLGIRLTVIGVDRSALAPALHVCDTAALAPHVTDGKYIPALLQIVEGEGADAVIPLIDHELPVLSPAREQFEALGCVAIVSAPGVIETCQDKVVTHRHLRRHGIDTPKTWPLDELLKRKARRYPLFMKPRRGSASFGNYVINDEGELRTLGRRVAEPIVQEFVRGVEHTLDVYTGFDGRPRCVVPRRRLEVRGGEVSKSRIVRDRRLIRTGCRVAESLEGCRGVITIQCIVTPRGRVRVIEINPRFGGGVPLAIMAGADLPGWIMSELIGRRPRIRMDGYASGLQMLRFDQSVFLDASAGRVNGPRRRRPKGRGR